MDTTELETLRPRLISHLYARCGDDAEDVVAEVLATVTMRLQRGSEVTPGFVWQLVNWRATDWLRQRNLRREQPDAETPNAEAPPDQYETGDQAEAQTQLLAGLSDSQRRLVLLRAEGVPLHAAAELLGISYSAAAKLAHRARVIVAGRLGRTPVVAALPLELPLVLPPEVPLVAMRPGRQALRHAPDGLTHQQLATLVLLASDLNYPEIAVHLGVSVNAVRNHLHVVFEKLQVHTGPGAVSAALRRGIIT